MLAHSILLQGFRLRVTTRQAGVCLWGLFALLIWAAPVRAQYRFDSWTTENGLPQNSVRAIKQTRDGYLWVATENGLARFDGVRFTVFNKLNTPEITSNRFVSLRESHDGDLWAGIEGGGVIRYHDGVFTAHTTKDGLLTNIVRRVDEDAAGTIWIYHPNGVSKWRDGRLIPAAPDSVAPLNETLTTRKFIGYGWESLGLWR